MSRPRISPSIALVALLAAVASAQETDRFGVYFDAGFSESELTLDEYPFLGTAHLVLENPTVPRVGGWECRIETQGSVSLVNWRLEGLHHNFLTAPNFFVGLGTPLPEGEAILLASCDVWVGEPGQGSVWVVPIYAPSIPYSTCYMDYDTPENLLPTTTPSGGPVAAWVNRQGSAAGSVTPEVLRLSTIVGESISGTVTVRSAGTGDLPVRPHFLEDPGRFEIEEGYGTGLLAPAETREIRISYSSYMADVDTVRIAVGENTPPVTVIAGARVPLPIWQAPTQPIHVWRVTGELFVPRTFMVRNTGDGGGWLRPQVGPGADLFTVTSDPPAWPIWVGPGGQATFYVYLDPFGYPPGTYSGRITFGEGVPLVELVGHYEVSDLSWEVAPDTLDFGEVYWYQRPRRTVALRNTGNRQIAGDISIDSAAGAFELGGAGEGPFVLDRGRTLEVEVRLAPTGSGQLAGSLDFGGDLPTIPLLAVVNDTILDCVVDPTFVDCATFGVGSGSWRTVIVTNYGTYDLELAPNLVFPPGTGGDVGAFEIEGFTPLVRPGDSGSIWIRFRPPEPGEFGAVLEPGPDHCAIVGIFGNGETDPGADGTTNRMALSFSESSPIDRVDGLDIGDEVTGHFVLRNPLPCEGVTYWNLWYELAPSLELVAVHEPGDVNHTGPHGYVGIIYPADSPLPVDDGQVVASLDLRVIDNAPGWIRIIGPTIGYDFGDRAAGYVLHRTATDTVDAWINPPGENDETPADPTATRLLPNVPNPFNTGTEIHYELLNAGRVSIAVHDLAGRRVALLRDRFQTAGGDFVTWSGTDTAGRPLPSGAYYVRLEANGHRDTRKILLLK